MEQNSTFFKSHLVDDVKVTDSCIRFSTDMLFAFLLLFYLYTFVDSEIYSYTYSSVLGCIGKTSQNSNRFLHHVHTSTQG